MRVLHVLSGLYAGGIEALALQLIAHSPSYLQAELLNTNSLVQEQLSAFQELRCNSRLSALHQWRTCDGPLLALRMFLLCRQRSFDALLIYPCNRPMLWLALGARIAGLKNMIVHLGNTAPADAQGKRTWHRLLLWFQRLGVLAVPCSDAIVSSLQPLPPTLRLGPVIPNGCDIYAISERASAARSRRPRDDVRRVLMVSRMDVIKDHDTLLRAFAAARQPGWQLQLVGDGPERSRLEALALQNNLEPRDVFLGIRKDIPELLGQADLFALSTTSAEGFGIVLIEAMGAGLPIIASDVPACREVLRSGELGDLLIPSNVDVWISSLKRLMTSEVNLMRLSQKTKSLVLYYDIRYLVHLWAKLLFQRSLSI